MCYSQKVSCKEGNTFVKNEGLYGYTCNYIICVHSSLHQRSIRAFYKSSVGDTKRNKIRLLTLRRRQSSWRDQHVSNHYGTHTLSANNNLDTFLRAHRREKNESWGGGWESGKAPGEEDTPL